MYVHILSLWLPILLSAVMVFIASSLIWTVFKWHDSDWKGLPDEEAAREALKGVPAGEYTIPYAADSKERQSEEWQRKAKEGPAAMLTVFPPDWTNMAKQFVQWFIYLLVISSLVAYLSGLVYRPGAEYLAIFRFVATVSFMTYSGGAAMGAIWFGQSWPRAIKDVVDGAIYGLLTAGVFGWLWP